MRRTEKVPRLDSVLSRRMILLPTGSRSLALKPRDHSDAVSYDRFNLFPGTKAEVDGRVELSAVRVHQYNAGLLQYGIQHFR